MKITCQDCGKIFEFTEQENRWYEERGFTPPRRCKECRIKRKNIKGGNNYGK